METKNDDDRASTLTRLHGTFMILAWVISASLGHIIARYFKKTWMIWRIYNYDVWFVIHVACMGLVWILTIIGFIIIVIDVQTITSSIHSIIGIIVVLVTFAQPIAVGVVRPEKGSELYKKYYLGHFIAGTLLQVFAVVCIFLSIKLERAYLPSWMMWAIGSYVLYYIFSHLGFTILDFLGNKKEEKRGLFEDKAYSKYRQLYLGLHVVMLLTFAIHFLHILWR
uniref:CSON005420 protein n=1 Tax=Culicoides sonorensis TaxID=179676 RepID=A0A336MQF6_CULSO